MERRGTALFLYPLSLLIILLIFFHYLEFESRNDGCGGDHQHWRCDGSGGGFSFQFTIESVVRRRAETRHTRTLFTVETRATVLADTSGIRAETHTTADTGETVKWVLSGNNFTLSTRVTTLAGTLVEPIVFVCTGVTLNEAGSTILAVTWRTGNNSRVNGRWTISTEVSFRADTFPGLIL